MKRQKVNMDQEKSHDSDSEGVEETMVKDTKTGNMIRYVNTPKKNKHRMRAHINPMNDIHIPVPKNPNYTSWNLHYPSFFGL